MSEPAAQIKARVSAGLKSWIGSRAKANKRSKSAEVEFLLEEARKRDEQPNHGSA